MVQPILKGAGAPYGGFHPHLPTRWQRGAAKALGATMWFFMFYRIREDGAQVFFGQHPWDHGHAGDKLIGSSHSESEH
ncbi:hypothetical protein CROQUDRAFT_35831 [Cronartium quercuum f. sp. fusiforme G11]|uniref:NADH dehydrogenase [ubiquinone] 1 beta subcomplex subunit 2 n=1 Tax=Cronartium quercuum f. sp. fusiforme G11 TaxID=708437 RepID=A0A9P6NXY8_9BASI|nr:hypothetical protein CROQUDRAFT_35831 [Cronartium quercuum f. sp. fusiforme G11]